MKIKSNIAISDSGLLFNPGSGESYSVNPTGAEIIRMIRENKTDHEIRDYFLAHYQTDTSTFEKDFHDFVQLLKQQLILDLSDESTT
ncbi:MAG TPA: PqqD family protein [Bacteroidales bacterium]|nr:PqqD family protein [Bacteroidales bacterium]HSA42166.1 PqqD family protein [Bacteroidales bacterium]